MDIEMMRPEERIAWAAGLYEAEGTIYRSQVTVKMHLDSVDRQVVDWFHQAVGIGQVYGPYSTRGPQPQFSWQANGWERISSLFNRFRPWLGARRLHQGESVLSARFALSPLVSAWNAPDPYLSRIWAAGLFEGEGSVCLSRSTCTTKMTMTDLDILEHLQRLLGGLIFGPYAHKTRGKIGKPYHIWHLSGWRKAAEIGVSFSPWLGERRISQFDAVLAHWPLPKAFPPPCGYMAPQARSGAGAMHHWRTGTPLCRNCSESLALSRNQKWRAGYLD